MKKSILFTLLFAFLLSACDGNRVEDPFAKYGYDSFPEELIAEYMPYEKGQELLFVSDNGDSLYFVVDSIMRRYHPYDSVLAKVQGGEKEYIDWEEFYDKVIFFKGNNKHKMFVKDASFYCAVGPNRSCVNWGICMYTNVFLNKTSRHDWDKSLVNPSDNPNTLFRYLTESIKLSTVVPSMTSDAQIDSSHPAFITKGKGLTGFTFYDTESRWTLVE